MFLALAHGPVQCS